jgi:hypothetical protein
MQHQNKTIRGTTISMTTANLSFTHSARPPEIDTADLLYAKKLKSSILALLAPSHKSLPNRLHGEFILRGERARVTYNADPKSKNSVIWYIETGKRPTIDELIYDEYTWNGRVGNYKTFRGVLNFLQRLHSDKDDALCVNASGFEP